MPKRRLGVALVVPAPHAGEIDGLRRALGDASLGRMTPHLTLVPPVNVRDERVPEALAVVRAAAASVPAPLVLRLGPPATFLPVNPVVFLAVDGAREHVERLRELRDGVFRPPLERRLDWPFVPHVTLADDLEPARIGAALTALAGYVAEVSFDRVHLFEEGPQRRWASIGDALFDRAAVVGRGGVELALHVSARLDAEAASWAAAQWTVLRGEAGTGPADLAVTARERGEIVGTATGWTRGAIANLSELIVAPERHRQGIGSRLLATFLSEAAVRGARLARLRADGGTSAERFYRARGWFEEARYPGPGDGVAEIVQLARHL